MIIHWWRIFACELVAVVTILMVLGIIKLPAFIRRKTLVRGFPWGYYTDAVPKTDPGFCSDQNTDFLHDVGTSFGGMQGFGEYGEFSGFGELGEYGAHFSSGDHGGE